MSEQRIIKNISSKSTYLAISNQFATAKNIKLLSRDAQKMEAWLISQIRPRDTDFKPYRITADQIASLFGVSKNYSYQKLNLISNELLTHIIHIKEGKLYNKYGLISKSSYHTGEGWCEMSIHPDLEPHLLNLKKNGRFAILELFISWSFKCVYSYPIYKYLKSFLHEGQDSYQIEIKVDNLKQIIGCPQRYPNYSNFNIRVLNPVKEEFDQKADIIFEYNPSEKDKKKVISIIITISRKEILPKMLQDISDINDLKPTDLDEKNISLELLSQKLKKLGWNGKIEELTQKTSIEAIEYYCDILTSELNKLNSSKINSQLLHEYIDERLKTNAQKIYNIFCDVLKIPTVSVEKRATKKYSDLGKELLGLGFVGDVESYIENEGRGIVKETLEAFKSENPKNLKNKIGFFREKIKTFKVMKELENKIIKEEKASENNILLVKLEKYNSLNSNFIEDYKHFMEIPSNDYPEDQKILQKYTDLTLSEMPSSVIKEFIEWKVGT